MCCFFISSRKGCSLHFFFFFQAEDGIRDLYVTGVQTCALPISTTADAGSTACSAAWPSTAARYRTGPRSASTTRRSPSTGPLDLHVGEGLRLDREPCRQGAVNTNTALPG